MEKGLIIIRGLPGSGKSTLAKHILRDVENSAHFEADQFMVNDKGEYEFLASRLHYAHSKCFVSVTESLDAGKLVVVSNTFTTFKEMKPYVDYCRENNHALKVFRMTSHFGSIHNVPENKMQEMRDRFQVFAGEVLHP